MNKPKKRPNHVWTERELSTLDFVYPIGGVIGAREALPHLTASQITSRATKRGLRAPKMRLDVNRKYTNLTPLAPADDRPSALDVPTVVRRGLGQWKADIPAVRWVFDLGAV